MANSENNKNYTSKSKKQGRNKNDRTMTDRAQNGTENRAENRSEKNGR